MPVPQVFFSALTLLAGYRNGIWPVRYFFPFIPRDFCLEQKEERIKGPLANLSLPRKLLLKGSECVYSY